MMTWPPSGRSDGDAVPALPPDVHVDVQLAAAHQPQPREAEAGDGQAVCGAAAARQLGASHADAQGS